jgi:hypothetical protein
MKTTAIIPEQDFITRVHFCPDCFKKHLPTSKDKGITPHYIVIHKVIGNDVWFWRSCHLCDCRDTLQDGQRVRVIDTQHTDKMPIKEWNACIVFNDDGY